MDNCEKISFPNVFSPNGDGLNDTFEPMNCPAFVKEASWEIYNRNGLIVAKGEGTEMVWNGEGLNGKIVPIGTYFYQIQIVYERLQESTLPITYKGYVELVK